MTHPTSDWEWEDTAEVAFQEWFNGEYGNFTFRCEWFFGDCELEDVNTRKDLMTKWLHSAFLTGYNTGRCTKTMTDFQPTPQTPEQVAEGLRDAMKQAKEDGVFDEPTKPMDDVVDRLVKKYQAQKLWNRVRDELGYSIDCCDEIVDLVESWLPGPQSAAGSQNVDVELLVDGFNDCVRKMNEMLR